MPARRLSLLLGAAVFINFVDRGNLATAAPVDVSLLALGFTFGLASPTLYAVGQLRTGSFYSAFALAIGVSLLGVLAWTMVIPRIVPVEWGRERDPAY